MTLTCCSRRRTPASETPALWARSTYCATPASSQPDSYLASHQGRVREPPHLRAGWFRVEGRSIATVVRVRLVNGRVMWMKAVEDDDEDWLRAINGRGRTVLLSRTRVKA